MEKVLNDEYYGLKEYHESLLELMDNIDQICRKYNIKYVLLYGTLLGAARHHGFIPWDDDLDIGFSREEFNKFISHSDELDKRFKIIGPDYYENKFWDGTTRLVYVGKQINESNDTTRFYDEMHNYIFIDMFIFDDTYRGAKFKIQTIRNKMMYGYAMSRRPHITYKKYSFVGKIQTFVLATLGKLMKFKSILKKKEKIMQKYNGKGSDYCCTFTGFPACPPLAIKKSYIEDTIEMDFEGRKYFCPREYDEYLTIDFNDWRQLPKEEDRVRTHCDIIL